MADATSELERDKELSDKKYKAAKAVAKWLKDFEPADLIQVLQHVGVELKCPALMGLKPESK